MNVGSRVKEVSFQQAAGFLATLVGSLVLAGWAFDVGALKSIRPDWVSMKPNTALAFVLTGLGLLLPGRFALPCGLLSGLIGLLTLAEYAFGWNPGIDQWLFQEAPDAVGTTHPGRVAPDAALCFVLLAAAPLIARFSHKVRRIWASQTVLGLLVTTLSLAAIQTIGLDGWWGLTPMAVPTAVVLAVLGAAVVQGSWRDAFGSTLKQFSRHLWEMLACAGALTIAFAFYARSGRQVAHAHELRNRSYLLADELRQSGDDLTRMVRTYVATGDLVYKERFQEILDIRDGKKLRPEGYGRPYFDLWLPGGPVPRPESREAIPLLELMRQAGFTQEEFVKLAEAKKNSDALTIPELEAMRLVESVGPLAEANRLRAVRMLYDDNYARAKFSVLKPIDEFLVLLDDRTLAGVRSAQTKAAVFRWVFAASGLALMFALWRAYAAMSFLLGGSVDEVFSHIRTIGNGDFSEAIPVTAGSGNSVLGWLSETQARLNALNRERMRAEAASRQNDQRFRDTFEQAAVGVAHVDLSGRLLLVNQRYADIVGRTCEEVMGCTFQQITHPEDLSTDLDNVRRLLDGEIATYSMEKRYLRKDATPVWVNLTVSLARDDSGAPLYFIAVVEDIAAHKEAEANLEASEKEFRLLAEAMPQIVWITRPDGWNTFFNHQWMDYTGLTLEESLGHGWNAPFHPDDQARAWAAWRHATETIGIYSLECRLRRADGIYKWWLIRGVPVRAADGGVLKWFGTCTDIHDLKVAEEEVQKLNAELDQRVRDRTAQLEAANKDMEAFSYSVSHDLRAPLRGMDGFSQALLEDYASQLDATGQDYLRRIRGAAQHMGQLIDDLLNLSRVTRSEMTFDSVDLGALARKAIAELQPQQAGRTVDWKIDDPLRGRGDARLLGLVLVNLLSNALKFTSKREDARIEFGEKAEGAERVFFVRDNGAGFDMADAGRLFGAFQRLHSVHEFPGTGIGLATVQRIIRRHGGRVWAEGQPGKGATFFFTLSTLIGAPS